MYSENEFVKSIIKKKFEYRTLDGSCNNKKHPEYCEVGQTLLRKVESDYKDGIGLPSGENRPSARHISNVICDQKEPIPNKKNCTNLFWLWGQFIDHDITLIGTNNELFNIPVPKYDSYFHGSYIPMHRSAYKDGTGVCGVPREYINLLSPVIDASNIYGSTVERNNYIREFKHGLLKTSSGGMLPITDGNYENAGPSVSSLFVSGDIRANEHVGLTAIHTLFMREHNYWAKKIDNGKLSDEEIYQKAKIIVEAEIEAITYNEFLPLLLGKYGLSKYGGYDCEVNPQMSNLFSVSCYRLHSLIPNKIFKDADLKDLFFKSHLICNKYDLDYIFKNYIKYKCEEIDEHIVSNLRNLLFGGGHDLVSFNIQRGRDHALPDYKTVREKLGLEEVEIKDKLKDVYCDNDIDVYIGGLCEPKHKHSQLGTLFHYVVKEQFERIRTGDRLWYENRLSKCQINHINNTKLSDIIRRNTCLKKVQYNVFEI